MSNLTNLPVVLSEKMAVEIYHHGNLIWERVSVQAMVLPLVTVNLCPDLVLLGEGTKTSCRLRPSQFLHH